MDAITMTINLCSTRYEDFYLLRHRALNMFARQIAGQSINKLHNSWLQKASEYYDLPYAILRTLYLVEIYHRTRLWRTIENCVTLIQFSVRRTLGLPAPNPSLGVCQIRPSEWFRARTRGEAESNNFRYGDLRALMNDRTNIFAAAQVLSGLLEEVDTTNASNHKLARLLAEKHFGYSGPMEGDCIGLEDLLYLMLRDAQSTDNKQGNLYT